MTAISEARREYFRARYRRNREAILQQQRTYRGQNGDMIQARVARWQRANPARAAAAQLKAQRKRRAQPEWRADHREREAWRNAAKKQATPAWADRAVIRTVYRSAAERGLTVDHIDPLQHPLVCGLHVPWNLQLLTAQANSKKNNFFEPYAVSLHQ